MLAQKPLPAVITLLVVIVTVHAFCLAYRIYYSYPWFDIPMHVLGGVLVGLLVLWFFAHVRHFQIKHFKSQSLALVLLGVLAFGIAWEVYEVYLGFTDTNFPGYIADLYGDLGADVIGALLAYLYFVEGRNKVVSVPTDIVTLHP